VLSTKQAPSAPLPVFIDPAKVSEIKSRLN